MKVVEVWEKIMEQETYKLQHTSLPTIWGPLAFCLHSALFPSVSLPSPAVSSHSADRCPWPFLLAPVSFYTNVSFSSALLCFYRSLSLILFVSIHSFFLHLVNIPLFSGFFRYKCAFKASHCYFLLVFLIESMQGMQIPSLLLMPFRPCRGQCDHHNLMPGLVLSPSLLRLQIVNVCSKCWNNLLSALWTYFRNHGGQSGAVGFFLDFIPKCIVRFGNLNQRIWVEKKDIRSPELLPAGQSAVNLPFPILAEFQTVFISSCRIWWWWRFRCSALTPSVGFASGSKKMNRDGMIAMPEHCPCRKRRCARQFLQEFPPDKSVCRL